MKLGNDQPSRIAHRAVLALVAILLFGTGLVAGGYRPIVEHMCPSACPQLELDVLASECQAARCAADYADDDREVNAAAFDDGLQTRPNSVKDIQRDAHTVAVAVGSPDDKTKSQKQTAHTATPKVWPKVLSVFTSRDPSKPDKLAGSSSAWPLPSLPVTMANMVPRGTPASKVPMDYGNRRVRADDFGIALRGVKRYTRAEVCQVIDGAKCCAIGPAITTGPWGALCRRPEDCSPGKKCERQIGDSARPGDTTEYWYTTQIGRDGQCEYRGAVDVTPAFRDVCGFRPMKPATVRLLR